VPYDRIVKCLKIFEKKEDEEDNRGAFEIGSGIGGFTEKLTYLDIKHYWEQIYFLLSQDLNEFTECGNLDLCHNYIDMLSKCLDLNEITQEEVLNTALFNVFRLVSNSLSIPMFDEQDYLPFFFSLMLKVIEKYPQFPSVRRNIAVAVNTLIFSCKEMVNYLHDFIIVSLITGYMDNLFDIYFSLAQTSYEEWDN